MAIRKIRNKRTGEIKEVDDSQLGQYGLTPQIQTPTLAPTPSAQEFPPESIVTPPTPTGMDVTKPQFAQPEQPKYITGRSLEEHTTALKRARAAGDKAAEADINADYNREFQYQQQAMTSAKPSEAMEKRERGLTDADRIVSLLEDKYFQGNKGKSIGYGKAGGVSKSLELTTAFGEKISPELEDISSYRALRDSARPAFARAMGDVGNLSEPEQRAAIKNIPDIFQTKGQALQYFKDVRQKLGLPERELEKETVTEQAPVSVGMDVAKPQFAEPEKPQQSFLEGLLQRGQEGAKRVTTGLEANWLGKLLFPRASEVQRKEREGEKVGVGERLGVAGETAFNVLPFAGPGGIATRLAVGGAAKGLTTPGASIEERFKQGGVNALTGFLSGKVLSVAGKLAKPYANQEKVLQKISETKFQGKPIRDAINAFIKENPESATWGKKVLAGIKDEYNPANLVDKLKIWNKAYSAAGKVGASEKAGVYDIASKAAREQIKTISPALTAARKFIGINERTKRLVGKYLPWIVLPAAGAGIAKVLGIGGSKE